MRMGAEEEVKVKVRAKVRVEAKVKMKVRVKVKVKAGGQRRAVEADGDSDKEAGCCCHRCDRRGRGEWGAVNATEMMNKGVGDDGEEPQRQMRDDPPKPSSGGWEAWEGKRTEVALRRRGSGAEGGRSSA